jgi:hypothetical protein
VKKKKKKKKPKKKKVEQSDPPRLGLSKLFPSGTYPEGELQPYKDEYIASCFHFESYLLFIAMPTALRQKKLETSKGLPWQIRKKPTTIFGGRPKYIDKSGVLHGNLFVLA